MTPRGSTVLLVDDDEALRRSVVRALELHGYRVLEAGDAGEARTVLAGAAGPVAVVIMDLVLPGLGGREAANLLVARDPEVRVLFTSGYTSQEALGRETLPEGQAFLRKPFDVPELLEAVAGLIDRED